MVGGEGAELGALKASARPLVSTAPGQPLGPLRQQSQPCLWHGAQFSDGLHHDYRVSFKIRLFLILHCLCQTQRSL